MNILIFGLDGSLRREKVKSVAAGVYHVSDTEGYQVRQGHEAIEIRSPLMGFNLLGLFPPKKGRLLVAAANDAQPLCLQAGHKHHYRPPNRPEEKELATALRDVETFSVLVAGQRAERKVTETKSERIFGHVIYTLLALFAIELFIMLYPKLGELWGHYFGN